MKSNFTRLSALFVSIFMIATMFAACGNAANEETGDGPTVDLELPATSSSDPVYVPGDSDTEPSTEQTPSSETETEPSSENSPSSETDPTTEEQTVKAKTTNTVNLREAASTDSTILGQIPKGAVVTLLDTSKSDWYKVSYNGKEGYVYAQNLDTNPSSTEMDLKGKVTANSLNIRDKASSDGNAIGSLAKGDVVTIIATENGWYKIKHGSGYGYVSSEYVSIIED